MNILSGPGRQKEVDLVLQLSSDFGMILYAIIALQYLSTYRTGLLSVPHPSNKKKFNVKTYILLMLTLMLLPVPMPAENLVIGCIQNLPFVCRQ